MESYEKIQDPCFKVDLCLTKPLKDQSVSKGLRRQSADTYIQEGDGR